MSLDGRLVLKFNVMKLLEIDTDFIEMILPGFG